MTTEDLSDPDEYTPEPDSDTATEEHEPEAGADDHTREANPADVAEQLTAPPADDEDLAEAEYEAD